MFGSKKITQTPDNHRSTQTREGLQKAIRRGVKVGRPPMSFNATDVEWVKNLMAQGMSKNKMVERTGFSWKKINKIMEQIK